MHKLAQESGPDEMRNMERGFRLARENSLEIPLGFDFTGRTPLNYVLAVKDETCNSRVFWKEDDAVGKQNRMKARIIKKTTTDLVGAQVIL